MSSVVAGIRINGSRKDPKNRKRMSGMNDGRAVVNNHLASAPTKLKLRRLVLDEIGAKNAHVCDLFAGEGMMWRDVWRDAASYVGIDKVWYRDDRLMFVGDNRRVMRAIDLNAFNIFDVDPWGCPWEQVVLVAGRRSLAPGEKLGLVLTEGSALSLKLGNYSRAMRSLAGLRGSPAGGCRAIDYLIDAAIAGLCKRMKAVPVRRWQARGKSASQMNYIGLVIEGQTHPLLNS